MIDAGTVQNGLKLISWILLASSGVCRSTLPTTAVWRETTTPFSTASICAPGNVDEDVARRRLAHRADALDVGLELRQPHMRRNVERLQRSLADDAIGRKPMPLLKAHHRGLDVGIERRRIAARLAQVA